MTFSSPSTRFAPSLGDKGSSELRWLVTGVTGLLGSNAAQLLGMRGEVVGAARREPAAVSLPFLPVDLERSVDRAALVERAGATAVLHAAAMTSMEACAANPARAWELNVRAAADLAAQAAASKVPFVYISTDAVFDGTAESYDEASPTSPISEYGRTKLEGERAVLAANPDALVARVNFFGWSPSGTRSLAEFFYGRLASGTAAAGFTDTSVNTIYVAQLVDALADLVAVGAAGVVNVVGSEETSKYEFGIRLARRFGFDPGLVVPARSSEMVTVPRAPRLNLATGLAERLLGRPMPDLDSSLARLRTDYEAGLPRVLAAFDFEKEI